MFRRPCEDIEQEKKIKSALPGSTSFRVTRFLHIDFGTKLWSHHSQRTHSGHRAPGPLTLH